MRLHARLLATLAIASVACGGTTPATVSPTAPTATMATTAAPSTSGPQVVIAFYTDAGCSAEVGRRRYDTTQSCFAWFAAGSAAQENSATRFQCWRDRLCYTQHPNSLTCTGAFATDKEARTDRCVKEPAGQLYALVVGGTETCPPAPAGFECPSSAAGGGTR